MPPLKRSLVFALALIATGLSPLRAEPGNEVTLDVISSPEHPRNSEGSFATLRSGRIVFYYTQFYGGASDYSSARIVEIHSDDQGRTWSQPKPWAEKGKSVNVMSVSLLRLASGPLAIFYVIKNSGLDCRPYMRVSNDEGATWSDPRLVIQAPGYFVLNNDRIIQTRSGRILVPVAFNRLLRPTEYRPHGGDSRSNDLRGIILWYYSDDQGMTWREADSWWALPVPSAAGLQEPGLVELADGTLYSWARTDVGEQFSFRSQDDGKTWTPPEPTDLKSPCSPASIKRLPGSSVLLAIYNDHSGRFPFTVGHDAYAGRTPLISAFSRDNGRTWTQHKRLESDLQGAFAYTAIHFVGDSVLLGYSAGKAHGAHLGSLRIRRLSLSWLQAP